MKNLGIQQACYNNGTNGLKDASYSCLTFQKRGELNERTLV